MYFRVWSFSADGGTLARPLLMPVTVRDFWKPVTKMDMISFLGTVGNLFETPLTWHACYMQLSSEDGCVDESYVCGFCVAV